MNNREVKKCINEIHESRSRYFRLLEKIKANKYHFPVIMGICSFSEVKSMYYKELVEVNLLAEAKLEKELFENLLLK
ncbi:hypothetical protein DB313_06230 (plasmid) [Borrelia turcica IST7]|uniref:DUF1322 domain-containing protein n=1 Tax=Borrelia turcica IST7 TaxID=1104446 RepID=A0A386PRG9_9SPIR|nr:DUF1322 family protein [Borrelia turcica]AYE37097.1 hypothetical protein DB313_06230 [Borrelia turcica IST7]